jgi:protein-tyrosine phosphatase
MRELGLDLSKHESQPASEQLVRTADLILTMTEGHYRAIVERWPAAAGRTHLVLPSHADVQDPIGRAVEAYRYCAEQIKSGVEFHAERIFREANLAA